MATKVAVPLWRLILEPFRGHQSMIFAWSRGQLATFLNGSTIEPQCSNFITCCPMYKKGKGVLIFQNIIPIFCHICKIIKYHTCCKYIFFGRKNNYFSRFCFGTWYYFLRILMWIFRPHFWQSKYIPSFDLDSWHMKVSVRKPLECLNSKDNNFYIL